MSKPSTVRKYGKQHKKAKAERLFAELPQTPNRPVAKSVVNIVDEEDIIDKLTDKITSISIQDENGQSPKATPSRESRAVPPAKRQPVPQTPVGIQEPEDQSEDEPEPVVEEKGLKVLSWHEVCPPGDKIVKIAEASSAEVYRVTNERGTSIIKVIRMESPIKAQTKAQEKARLLDEQPHSETALVGELKISEWLADIPGFVVYKERYIVQGKACGALLETHQSFHKRAKRKDPGRLQFYPSPSRYLDNTKFLVVELGDAGIALEDYSLVNSDQLWDILFHVAIALARAEIQVEFEHRDLHEGNLCIRTVGAPIPKEERDSLTYFGFSGLEITILDYGLSRASVSSDTEESEPVAYDLEKDLSLFTSEHAPQCKVYRQMRSFLLRGDRRCLSPRQHTQSYEEGVDGPLDWRQHEPYTNVLWLAYIYQYIIKHFRGPKKELAEFEHVTREFWAYLDPEAADSIPGFASASDIIRFAVESGWVAEEQLIGSRDEAEKSILSILTADDGGREFDVDGVSESHLRRSPRRRQRDY